MLPINKIHNLNCLDGLKQIPDESVDCVVTSPPYWGLRNYKTEPQIFGGDGKCDHVWVECKGAGNHKFRPGKNGTVGNCNNSEMWGGDVFVNTCSKCGAYKGEVGLEPNKDNFISNLCDIFDEVRRVLKNSGTCWVNLGDTYSSAHGVSNLPAKCLALIPQRFAIEMTGRGWILRNSIVWHKPNAMPSSVRDRFSRDYENIFFFTKKKKYFFEQQLEDVANKEAIIRSGGKVKKRNKRETWSISTVGNPNGHFAMYPEELVETPILAGCPALVCSACGKPQVKDKKKVGEFQRKRSRKTAEGSPSNSLNIMQNIYEDEGYRPTCDCGVDFKKGLVLDPFMGAGTTAIISKKLDRDYIGFELNEEYVKIAENRINSTPRNLF